MSPSPAAVRWYISAGSPATGGRCAVSARLATSVATIITGVARNTMRALRTAWIRSTPRTPASSASISAGNRRVRMTMSCEGMTKRSGLRAVSIQSMIEL